MELDHRNTEVARGLAAGSGLANVGIVTGDAALTRQYTGFGPAQVVLACGLFGNLTDADVKRVTGYCSDCAPPAER